MNKCNVIKDLLPLYADEVCSEDSRGIVEEHIASCDECRNELESYCYNTGLPEVNTEEVLKKFKKKMSRKNLKKVAIGVIICLAVIFSSVYVLFIPEFTVPYSENLLTAKIPVDGGIDISVNLPNYAQVYSVAEYNADNDEIDVYLAVTRNLWSMIAPDFDETNNFWRTNGFIGVSYQASDDIPFKESHMDYFSTRCEIVRIHYAEYESTHITDRKTDFERAVRSEEATTHLIWSASEG